MGIMALADQIRRYERSTKCVKAVIRSQVVSPAQEPPSGIPPPGREGIRAHAAPGDGAEFARSAATTALIQIKRGMSPDSVTLNRVWCALPGG
jgi:hypothetical protein